MMRAPKRINQTALNETRLMFVDESFNLDGDGIHGFRQPNVRRNFEDAVGG